MNNALALGEIQQFMDDVATLDRFEKTTPEYQRNATPGYLDTLEKVRRRLPVLEAIGEDLDPDAYQRVYNGISAGWGLDVTTAACQELVGRIENQELITRIQGPQGPVLVASGVHVRRDC